MKQTISRGARRWQVAVVFRDGKKGLHRYHLGRYIGSETINLFADVTKESVAFPSPSALDGGSGNLREVHRHGAAASEGMAADVVDAES
jgi:hypothetical protein